MKQPFTNAAYLGFGGSLVIAAIAATAVSAVYGAGWGDGLRWFLYTIATIGISTILGLIFGVPRARKRFLADASERYEANSNLEEISDWLTKLLVGAGLVELSKVPEGLASLGNYLGVDMKVPNSSAYSITSVLFGSGLGFIFGYVWARLRLRVFLETYDRLASVSSRTGSLVADLRIQNDNTSEIESESDLEKAVKKAVEIRESVAGDISPILWADDKPHNNMALIIALRSLDVDVDLALTTPDAIELFDSRNYGVVISGLGREENGQYNEAAGIDLINSIRSKDKMVHILVFSGQHAFRLRDKLVQAGASKVIRRASVLLEQATLAAVSAKSRGRSG